MSAKSLTQPAALLYNEDFALWTAETARLLRQGRLAEIDIEHVAEEIEDLAKNGRRKLFRRLTTIIRHLLKRRLGRQSRNWKAAILTERTELETLLEQSPSLRREARASMTRVYGDASAITAAETGPAAESFPREIPFTPEQILDQDFFPSR